MPHEVHEADLSEIDEVGANRSWVGTRVRSPTRTVVHEPVNLNVGEKLAESKKLRTAPPAIRWEPRGRSFDAVRSSGSLAFCKPIGRGTPFSWESAGCSGSPSERPDPRYFTYYVCCKADKRCLPPTMSPNHPRISSYPGMRSAPLHARERARRSHPIISEGGLSVRSGLQWSPEE